MTMYTGELASQFGGQLVVAEYGDSLRELVRWKRYMFGPRGMPVAIAAVNRAHYWADVVILRGHDQAAAYRTLLPPDGEPLRVTRVVWHYISDAELTLWAVLRIHPDAVAPVPYPIPPQCRIPEIATRHLVVLPGSPIRRPITFTHKDHDGSQPACSAERHGG